jgi:hypothetical protein
LAPKHGRLIRVEKDRVRFPASGFRPKSYDRTIHMFVRRMTPTRLRCVMGTRFKSCRPTLAPFYKLNVARYELTRSLRQRRARLKSVLHARYLSRASRELLQATAQGLSAETTPPLTITHTKRRFASLPVKAVQAERRAQRRALRP